jgi:capsular polysaccharide biosynthesis protein
VLRLISLRLLESYFHRRWLYLLPCVIMAAAAYLYVSRLPVTYTSHGTLYVQNKTLLSSLTAIRNDGLSWVTPAQATVSEVYELLNTKAFVRAIIENTDLEIKVIDDTAAVENTIKEARNAIWVQTLGSNLVLIGAVHEMPRVTHQLVTSTIDTYIRWKSNLSRDDSVAAQEFFTELIGNYETELMPARQALADYLRVHPKPVRGERPEQEVTEIALLQAAVDRAQERLSHAQNQEESARLALVQTESDVRQSYSIVDAPLRPLTPERSLKELALTVAVFLFAGVALSATAIVGAALLDQTHRFPIDVKHGLHLPVLAMVAESSIDAPTASPSSDSGNRTHSASKPFESTTAHQNGGATREKSSPQGHSSRRGIFR